MQMGKRGPRPRRVISTEWSANFAYAIGLIMTDGCLYNDERHINLTSKDLEQIENFQKCLGIVYHIGKKASGIQSEKKYYVIQIGNVGFYKYLEGIGITSNKSKTIGSILVPDQYYPDFLRGAFDGDGSVYSYWDSRWKSSFMYYLHFTSASIKHIDWLRKTNLRLFNIKGHVTSNKDNTCFQLKYAKRESLILLRRMYYSQFNICLSRKKLKLNRILDIVGERRLP